MPPAYVKPYVKRQKNDMADAEAICEAVTRANMRFVPTKTPEQQSGLMLHRTRHLFIRQQTSVINAIRAHFAEFGVTAPVGRKGIEELLRVIADPSDKRVPDVVRVCLAALGSQLLSLKKQILEFDRKIMAWHRSNQTSKRLNCIPGVVRCWPPRWSRASPIRRCSDQVATSRPGSGWSPNSTRAEVELGSAVSANRGTAICAACCGGALAIIRYAKLHGTKYRPWVAALAQSVDCAKAANVADWAADLTGRRNTYPSMKR